MYFTDFSMCFTDLLFFSYLDQYKFDPEINLEEFKMRSKNFDKRLITGIFILIAGALLLASNFGLLSYEVRRYIFRWEVILIGIGVISLFSNHKKGFGIVLIAVGGALYLRDLVYFNFNFWQLFWPAMLIIIGLVIIFHHTSFCKTRTTTKTSTSVPGEELDEVTIFGSTERVIDAENFKGGKLTAIFGGQKLIFTKGKIQPGMNSIEIFALFGGFEIVVPDNWRVRINVTPIFGGFSDKKMFYNQGSETENELVITGTVIFGGGEIKSF
jgi:predicted membrane protein